MKIVGKSAIRTPKEPWHSVSIVAGAARAARPAGSLVNPGLASERLERLEQQVGELRAMVEELQIELQTRP